MNKQESGYRWVVFGTVLFAYFVILCQRTAPGLITDQLMKDFHVSASTIGLLSSVQFLAYSVLQIPAGLLSDRYGPNRFLIIGTLILGRRPSLQPCSQ
jgi:sugar phosphate permease